MAQILVKLLRLLNRKRYIPVRSISAKGKFLVAALRTAFSFRRFLGGSDWDTELPGHHEDPLHMRPVELLHMAHKYYYRIINKASEGNDIHGLIQKNREKLRLPDHFVAEQSITLSAGGDLMPYYCITKEACSSLWDECGDFFFGADIATANLETPLDLTRKASAVPEVMLKNMYFNSSSEMFGVYSGSGKFKGYQVLSVANNHSLDQGESGLLHTLKFLEEKSIPYCGAAKREDLRDNFPIIEKNGIRIAFLAATFSLNALTAPAGKEWLVNHLNLNTPHPDIQLLIHQSQLARERGADLIVAHLHMGLAYQPYPSNRTVETMHRICEQTGIDILLGGHPHNPQPFEFYSYTDPFSKKAKQSSIIYSLGDFVAYDIFKWCHLPMMLKFTISKGESGTCVTNLETKLAYMQAEVQKGRVINLKLRDFSGLLKDSSSLDPDSLKEFRELEEFAREFLLTGNVVSFLAQEV